MRATQGGGGAVGSASLDSLMDRVPFRAKPKIVDLTSQRKLADKVGCGCGFVAVVLVLVLGGELDSCHAAVGRGCRVGGWAGGARWRRHTLSVARWNTSTPL